MPSRPRASLDDAARAAQPLTPIVLNILLALVDRDRHGLGIAEHVEDFTRGNVTLGPGTLYGSIKRLLEQGLIDAATAAPGDDRADPRRRYYTITATGRRALELQAREFATVVGVARAKKVI